MKNYSSNRAQRGKVAYRTPSLFKANKAIHYADLKSRIKNNKIKNILICCNNKGYYGAKAKEA